MMRLCGWIGAGLWVFGSVHAASVEGIVLVIADGTSQELITATRNYSLGATGKLNLEKLPQTAIVRTYSASDLVTDSAAAATSMARGIKADNLAIGMARADAATNLPSILDLAKKAGWSTGVVTDDEVIGATSAAFLVEHFNRRESAPLAAKLVEQFGTRVDVVLGGGSKWFKDASAETAYLEGELPLVQATAARLQKLPVRTFFNWEEFVADKNRTTTPILGLFATGKFSFYADGKRTLRLRDMVAQAVELLRQRNRPFLLVVEAALPDKACHLNQAKRAFIEVLEFDETLGWLSKNLGPNVLLLATTDHATGGFNFNGPSAPIQLKGDSLFGTHPVTGMSYFTWASGPGAQPDSNLKSADPKFTQPALIPRESAFHTASDVWLLGEGLGSENVKGFLDNTDIYQIMARTIESSEK